MEKSIHEKLGQMFIIRMQGQEITDELVTLIKDYHIGGITLYTKNYDNYEQMLKLINRLKTLNKKYHNTPLFIAIDQEGGRVNRLPSEFKNIVSAKKLSVNKEYVKKGGQLIGNALNNLGINMDFAPVLDIQRFEDRHAIGNRCYGTTKEKVTDNSLIVMNALKDHQVLPVVKHFPGHGLVKRDSHLFLPVTYKNIRNTDDIVPFEEAIKNGCDAIMVSHIMIQKIDRLYPASLSKKVINNYLRGELNYQGLIVTDDLKMKAVNLLYGYKRSSLKAIKAGNDVIVIGSKFSTVIHVLDYLQKRLKDEVAKSIEDSYNKIIDIKKKYHVTDDLHEQIDLKKYNKEVEELNKVANANNS